MAGKAAVHGHPIHPMLVAFPIGLWTFSLACDVVYLAYGRGAYWSAAARYSLAAGIVGALLAAVPGLIDLLSLADARVKKIAIYHMSINLVAVVVFGADLWLRMMRGPEADPPVLVSVVGIALILVSGWLGGELVYVHGVAVDRPGGPTGG
ncbi:MAG TPA: DUF2231 domain-containing protein [Vicinamibacteria bacterium]|nr:DUF2231 domain-containing protein [Vicinamibacteria bacterium]